MDKYAVFGNPIAQSKSPIIHAMFAEQTNQPLSYESILAPKKEFASSVKAFFDSGAKGCNITAPFKQEAYEFASSLTDRAKLAGAVNTLFKEDNQITGDTTDGVGLVNDLIDNNFTLHNSRILILGAGGATRGCLLSLLEQQPKSITVANRTITKAQLLAEVFSPYGEVKSSGFELGSNEFDLVINATSTGLSGEIPLISESVVENKDCYDMSYSKGETPFLKWCSEHGAKKTVDGLGMLVKQAAESFYIWRGINPNTQPVLTYLRETMG